MKKFKINKFLSLKLEEGKTNIYINGECFDQCKYLMLNIPVLEVEKYNEIESIDEAADVLGWRNEGQEGVECDIDPETEFWGHCSNLQAWYEHNYDTRLLHSNLAFPLLDALTGVGDPLARKVFKEEIVKRLESGYPTVVEYIFRTKIMDHLNREERSHMLEQTFPAIIKSLYKTPKEDMYETFCRLLEIGEEKGWIDKYFPNFLEIIPKLQGKDIYWAFIDLTDPIKNTALWNIFYAQIETQFLALLNDIKRLPVLDRNRIFSHLFNLANESRLIKEHFPIFIESIIPFLDKNIYNIFSDLIHSIENIELLIFSIRGTTLVEEYHTQIGQCFLRLLKAFKKIPDHAMGRIWDHSNFFTKNSIFSDLIKAVQGTTLVDEYRPQIEAQFNELLISLGKPLEKNRKPYYGCDNSAEQLTNTEIKNHLFFSLFKITKIIGFRDEYVPFFLKAISEIPKENKEYAFSEVRKRMNKTLDSFRFNY